MNILSRGKDLKLDQIKKIKGVLAVNERVDDYEVKIKDDSVIQPVFQAIHNNEITKFDVLEASLNEIFIEKVGESYEK